ncbi:UNKNOWN [Stylonychia lemnae]|uniref:Cyclic nucleotide-binding domain-containing protein n=1 Tax=Stylonychia lemnae TaxID=5949 RepID=A0A078AZM3_STYLE|nr:UNKNOWN [Stylonychia lemnae]|eukprot:CDW87639.1 UNKNOWN [Stylonychia lemnae]
MLDRSPMMINSTEFNISQKEDKFKDKTSSSLSTHLKKQQRQYGIAESNMFSSCKTTAAFSPRQISQASIIQNKNMDYFTPQSEIKASQINANRRVSCDSRKSNSLIYIKNKQSIQSPVKQTIDEMQQNRQVQIQQINNFLKNTKKLISIMEVDQNIIDHQNNNKKRPQTSKFVNDASERIEKLKLLSQPEEYNNDFRIRIDSLFGKGGNCAQIYNQDYEQIMNPHKYNKQLTPFQVIDSKQEESERSKEEIIKVLEFLKDIYPLSLLDEFNLKELYKKLSTTKSRQIFMESAKYLQKEFFIFSQISTIRLEKICQDNSKHSYYRRAGEYVFLEGMSGDYLYIVRDGVFVTQKEVVIEHQNFWPQTSETWKSSLIKRKVLFTANKLVPGIYFGEKEVLNKKPYLINLCAAERGSQLIVIPRTELMKCFTEIELDKIRTQPCVIFPNEEEIKRRIQIMEKVVSMKKIAFLNATNTNFLPESMRDFYQDPSTKKLHKWVHGIESRTRKKLNSAIQQKDVKKGQNKNEKITLIDDSEKLFLEPADDRQFPIVMREVRTFGKLAFKGQIDQKEQRLNNIAKGVVESIIKEARNDK